MLPLSVSRWFVSAWHERSRSRMTGRAVESCPPLAFAHRRAWSSRLGRWLAASAWHRPGPEAPRSPGERHRIEMLAEARLDFADALFDVRTLDAADTLDRIAVTRSLHDLWHLRAEVFSHVSRRHGQLEATRRLADIDCHFRTRPRRFGIAPAADRGAGDARRG